MTSIEETALTPSELEIWNNGLDPCPFCGGAAEMEPWHGGAPTKVAIWCSNREECEVHPGVTGETPKDALFKWNKRV